MSSAPWVILFCMQLLQKITRKIIIQRVNCIIIRNRGFTPLNSLTKERNQPKVWFSIHISSKATTYRNIKLHRVSIFFPLDLLELVLITRSSYIKNLNKSIYAFNVYYTYLLVQASHAFNVKIVVPSAYCTYCIGRSVYAYNTAH